jgi:hypothetical protein
MYWVAVAAEHEIADETVAQTWARSTNKSRKTASQRDQVSGRTIITAEYPEVAAGSISEAVASALDDFFESALAHGLSAPVGAVRIDVRPVDAPT